MGMNYLITGGAGFIGSHLTETLSKTLESGNTLRVLDNLSTGFEHNVKSFLNGAELVEGDIRDQELLIELCRDTDVIFHFAALPSVSRSVEEPALSHDVNVNGTINVLEAARLQKVDRVILSSSSSVYGDSERLPKEESHELAPKSPYAAHKAIGELYAKLYHDVYGLKTYALRYFNVFGARQNPNSDYAAVIPSFITAFLNDKAPTVYGDGEQSRDFTYVSDVVQANLQCVHAPETAAGQAYNVACGGRYSLNELLKILAGLIGSQVEAIYADERAGDVKHSQASVEKASTKLGWEPQVSFEEGLEKTISFFKEQKEKMVNA